MKNIQNKMETYRYFYLNKEYTEKNNFFIKLNETNNIGFIIDNPNQVNLKTIKSNLNSLSNSGFFLSKILIEFNLHNSALNLNYYLHQTYEKSLYSLDFDLKQKKNKSEIEIDEKTKHNSEIIKQNSIIDSFKNFSNLNIKEKKDEFSNYEDGKKEESEKIEYFEKQSMNSDNYLIKSIVSCDIFEKKNNSLKYNDFKNKNIETNSYYEKDNFSVGSLYSYGYHPSSFNEKKSHIQEKKYNKSYYNGKNSSIYDLAKNYERKSYYQLKNSIYSNEFNKNENDVKKQNNLSNKNTGSTLKSYEYKEKDQTYKLVNSRLQILLALNEGMCNFLIFAKACTPYISKYTNRVLSELNIYQYIQAFERSSAFGLDVNFIHEKSDIISVNYTPTLSSFEIFIDDEIIITKILKELEEFMNIGEVDKNNLYKNESENIFIEEFNFRDSLNILNYSNKRIKIEFYENKLPHLRCVLFEQFENLLNRFTCVKELLFSKLSNSCWFSILWTPVKSTKMQFTSASFLCYYNLSQCEMQTFYGDINNYMEIPIIGILPLKLDESFFLKKISNFNRFGYSFTDENLDFRITLNDSINNVHEYVLNSTSKISLDYEFYMKTKNI